MATTTNYGWTTPDDTALVKDGAAAIRTLGSSVDTTTKALNPSTTLGDVEYRSSTANTNTRLGIGTTGQVLTVAGGVPSWATPAAGGGITQIGTTATLSGASTTVSFSATGYKNLYALISGINASAHAKLGIQPNSQTTTIDFTGLGGYGSGADPFAASDSYLQTYQQWDDANTVNNAIFTIYDCESTTLNKNFDFTVGYRDNSNRRACEIIGGLIKDTNAITAIKFVLSAGSFSAGEVRIFGEK